MSSCPYTGGSRRRSSKRKTMKRKHMKGGVMYGFGGALDGTTAGASWGGVANNAVDPVSLKAIPGGDYAMPGGRRRRRTGKKATRKGKKSHRRRTMRGGAGVVNAAGVGYGFGPGSLITAGPPDAGAYASRVGGAPTNPDMVRSA